MNASQNTQVHVKSKNLSFQNFQKAAQIGALLFMYVENKCQLQHLQCDKKIHSFGHKGSNPIVCCTGQTPSLQMENQKLPCYFHPVETVCKVLHTAIGGGGRLEA